MKQNVNFSMFVNGFQNRKENFSYEGLRALFDWLENLEDDTGEEIEFDPIALCCEFSEYDSLEDFNNNYDPSDPVESIEELEEKTMVIRIDGSDSFIVQDF